MVKKSLKNEVIVASANRWLTLAEGKKLFGAGLRQEDVEPLGERVGLRTMWQPPKIHRQGGSMEFMFLI